MAASDHEDMEPDGAPPPRARPQALVLNFLGAHVYRQGICVSSQSVIDVLERLGVSERAARSTLTRMVRRNLLCRQRSGRRMYFGVTARSHAILEDGERRVWEEGAINYEHDGFWTLLGFSLPKSWKEQRHSLRSRLAWSGFAPLQSGLWIAPSDVDVSPIIDELGLGAHINVFVARPGKHTDLQQMIHDAWDLEGLARRYRNFLHRWDRDDPLPDAADDLARRLQLATEWMLLLRQDPRLPIELLPEGWEAKRAQQVFHALDATYLPSARAIARATLDTIPNSHQEDANE